MENKNSSNLEFEIAKLNQVVLQLMQQMSSIEKKLKSPIEQKYMSENKVKELLGKGTTWFWEQRTSGKLPYHKVGNEIFYKTSDIEKLFEDNKFTAFN